MKKGKHIDKVANVISKGCDNNFYSVTSRVNSMMSWHQELVLENSIKCNFKLDTGSDVNLIINVVLYNSRVNVVLQAYNGSQIRVIGVVLLEIQLKFKQMFAEFIVTANVMFFRGSGCFPSPYKLTLKQGSVPLSKPPNGVPLVDKEKLKYELDCLCTLDIISKVDEPTEWVNCLLIAEKADGSVCVCLEPQALKAIN
ncbi:hypothetical protein PR048_030992 [Dryococelus australis]|uniref:Uncharacterized protein n=1 Tax=Dryococelus australis TaxID=614101 RepID=A0ABQ9G580_9NEOP|nr:hypothetical protein PR048_030992 [Dryococelus australis]